MTEQEIFNRVWAHLNKQGHQAFGKYGSCQYRTSNGDACAVGCLLDDATATLFDAKPNPNIADIFKSTPDLVPTELHPHIAFLDNLQNIHDRKYVGMDGTWLENWQRTMRRLAWSRKLDVQA